MKRVLTIVIVFSTLTFTALGCRQYKEGKAKPVTIPEEYASDFVIPFSVEDYEEKLLKKEKEVIDPNETDKQKEDKQKARDEKQRKERLAKMRDIARAYVDAVKAGAGPNLTLETLKLRLIRQGKRPARKFLEEGTVEVVFEVDVDQPEHIVVWRNEQEEGGNDVALVNGEFKSIKGGEIKTEIRKQALKAIWGYMKRCPDKTPDGFTAYFKANAAEPFYRQVADGQILLNPSAFGNGGQMLAVERRIEQKGPGIEPERLTVMGNGEVRFFPESRVKPVFGK